MKKKKQPIKKDHPDLWSHDSRFRKEEFSWSEFEEEAIDRLKSGEELTGKDGVLAPLIKRLIEASLEGELDHLKEAKSYGKERQPNHLRLHMVKLNWKQVEIELVLSNHK